MAKLESKKQRIIRLPPRVTAIPSYIERSIGHVDVKFKGCNLPKWQQLFADLVAGATFADGRPIQSAADCFQWFVEQATNGPEGPEGPDAV